jgi:two-component system OmpR family response regulator
MSTNAEPIRVLLVEDDELMVHLITRYLDAHGFEVTSCTTGPEGLSRARSGDFAVVLLDVQLPGMSGVDVLKRLRREGSRVPVLIVSSDADKQHIAASLDEGADDYVPKPVDPAELPARIRAVLRRHHQTVPDAPPRLLVLGDVSFDEARRCLTGPEGDVTLTATEAALLRELIRGAGRLISAEELQERIWGMDFDPGTNVVAVHVSRLRSKLTKVGSTIVLKATRRAGYEIVV